MRGGMRGGRGGGGPRFDPYSRGGRGGGGGGGMDRGGYQDNDPLSRVDPVATRDAYLRELMLRDPVMRDRLAELLDRDRGGGSGFSRDPYARPEPSYYR